MNSRSHSTNKEHLRMLDLEGLTASQCPIRKEAEWLRSDVLTEFSVGPSLGEVSTD